MANRKTGGCEGRISRRQVLRAGVAAATIGTLHGVFGDADGAQESAPVRPIDIHAHYFPESYLSLLAKEGKHPNSSDPKFTDLQLRLADMDKKGIAVQAISLTTPMLYWGDGQHSLSLAKAWNDSAVAAHRAYPTRFVVLATLPMQFPGLAIAELDRVARLPGVRGVYMGTNIAEKDLDEPLFEPIFARIEQLGLPVFLHPVTPLGGNRFKNYYLSNLMGNPIDGTTAAAHLIFGGVLDRHPNLTVCLPHSGGALLALIGRWDRGWRVRPEDKGLPKAPSEYLHRFVFDTVSHSKPYTEYMIEQVGADRILTGSDYCFDMGVDEPVKFIQELDLPAIQRNMILNGNAAKLLKL
ncbi:MAG: amidohydrolase family protein [Candidatus Acidiferrales bacterium]